MPGAAYCGTPRIARRCPQPDLVVAAQRLDYKLQRALAVVRDRECGLIGAEAVSGAAALSQGLVVDRLMPLSSATAASIDSAPANADLHHDVSGR